MISASSFEDDVLVNFLGVGLYDLVLMENVMEIGK